jgi:acid phosphatase
MPGIRTVRSAVALVAAAVTVVACSSTAAGGQPASPPRAETAASAPTSAAVPPTKVLLIVEENENDHSALRHMPFLARLGRRYGHTTHFRASAHPSLPNYLALAGGSTFGVRDDADPSAHRLHAATVFDQALARNDTAKAYAESMPGNCTLTSSGRYAVRHNPWTYFHAAKSRANCRRDDVPSGTRTAGALHDDVVGGTLPTVGMVTPNLDHDAHDGTLAAADRWLKRWMAVIRSGPDWTSGQLAIVITFDENNGTAKPNTVLTTVVSPTTHHVVSSAHLTDYSWTRYADRLIGAHLLRHAKRAHSLRAAFGL